MMETVIIIVIAALAAVFLGWRTVKTFRSKNNGCGCGCGSSKTAVKKT
ncbi:MAG: FeoB-associated Cys-rich membrane protein [Treponema sp.]|jgi:hypothetical protein|nr:FeoB-associated Cys-rich membrane protein [Treponema sp.]